MIQFQVYLKSELGKLRIESQADSFLRSVNAQVIQQCGLPMNPTGIVVLLPAQNEVDTFVAGLSDGQLRSLTKTCAEDWRKSNAYHELNQPGNWSEDVVKVDRIDVQQAESELGEFFRRNDYHLSRIVGDNELLQQEPYKSSDLTQVVEFPVCLGVLSNGRYRLFDGIHRAIQLVRCGRQSIQLVYRVK